MNTKSFRATAVLGAALLIAPITAFGATVTPSGAGAATPTHVLTCADKPTAKPSSYILSCADANAAWTGITWSAWSATSASGHGFLHQNECIPNCASGKFVNYRASLTLSKAVASKKYGELFSIATFHYRASGKAKSETFELND
jgi:hypothetical protein